MPLDDPLTYREELRVSPPSGSFPKSILSSPVPVSWARVRQASISLADQVFSVGGMFLVNVALARTQTKHEYGLFALSYSAFIFLLSLHNAAILETFTVYGAGRYQKRFQQYLRLIWRKNALLAVLSTVLVCLVWSVLAYLVPAMASRTFLGMALSLGVLFTATFLRRAFYVRRRPDLAARFSFVFFCSCVVLLWLALRFGVLDGFYGYVIAAVSWVIAAFPLLKEFPRGSDNQDFVELEPGYWAEHWKYSRWVLVTAFVFQLTTQGYFWLVASFLTVSDTGNLRALYNIVLPLDQLFVALSMVVLPVMCSRYATQKMAGLLPLWKSYFLGWLAITASFVVLVHILGKPAVHVLYAGKFDNISSLVPLVAFLPLVLGTGHTVNGALKAAEKPNLVFYAYSFSGVATFLFGIPLVIHLGLRGAVYGMLLSGATYTTALLIGFWIVLHSEANHAISISDIERG